MWCTLEEHSHGKAYVSWFVNVCICPSHGHACTLQIAGEYCITCNNTAITIHVSLLACACRHSQVLCTVPDVMVGVITGEVSWPAVMVRKDFLERTQFLQLSLIRHTFVKIV